MRLSKQIIHVNALRLRISRNTSVALMTCGREANHTPARSGKELTGFGLVLDEWGKAKGNRACVGLDAVQKGASL